MIGREGRGKLVPSQFFQPPMLNAIHSVASLYGGYTVYMDVVGVRLVALNFDDGSEYEQSSSTLRLILPQGTVLD